MAEICKAAGVPKGSFCYFFESEETEAGQRAVQEGCGTVSGCLFGNLTWS